ncbi:epoxyqueuosine reductase QueH [Candidatus Woesearchaeota archaeon]|nr:epoxyqueuosine reductase QueH [Candidatus Woesearchaeota archaeon]
MKLLLHVCCGPCATESIRRLKDEHEVICYFYNPCVEPKEEYERRKDAFVKVCDALAVDYVIGDYDNRKFREIVKGLEAEPENGRRCLRCYEMRLKESGRFAKENGFDVFATTLTISPHKNSRVIFDIGNKAGSEHGVKFLGIDFKKNEGFANSVKMSKELDLYRQNYCGCRLLSVK